MRINQLINLVIVMVRERSDRDHPEYGETKILK